MSEPQQVDVIKQVPQANQQSEAIDPSPADEAASAAGLSLAVRVVGVTALVMTLVGALLGGFPVAVGVGLGGLLAVANLALFARLGKAFLDRRGNAAPWAVLGLVKLLGLFACVFLVLRTGEVSALALAVGYGAMPVGIALSSLFSPKSSS